MKHADLIMRLPEAEREEAKQCLIWAEAQGWTNIGLWTYDQPPDIGDIFGVPPSGHRGGMVTQVLAAMNGTYPEPAPGEPPLRDQFDALFRGDPQ